MLDLIKGNLKWIFSSREKCEFYFQLHSKSVCCIACDMCFKQRERELRGSVPLHKLPVSVSDTPAVYILQNGWQCSFFKKNVCEIR